MIHVAIIAGGKGERFWPFSTRENPKQLLKIASDKTMLEETLDRVSEFVPLERTVIVTGENIRNRFLNAIRQLRIVTFSQNHSERTPVWP